MINEEDGNGTLTRTYWHHPQAGGRAALAHADGANPAQGAWGYYLHDHLGSTRRIHNHAKKRIARFDYTPYGELFHAENPSVSTRRFTGHDWSAPAALYFAPYRYYNPSPARWLTRDPLGMVDGPNVYAYVHSSPTNLADPLGLSSQCCDTKGLSGCIEKENARHRSAVNKINADFKACSLLVFGGCVPGCILGCTAVAAWNPALYFGCMKLCVPKCIGLGLGRCNASYRKKMTKETERHLVY